MNDNDFTLNVTLSGALMRPYGVLTLVPITNDTLHDLKPGEWIWDDKLTERRIHKKTLGNETIMEPIGFRQIDILDLDLYPRWSSKPFKLSDVSGNSFDAHSSWTYFEEGRFFRLERED